MIPNFITKKEGNVKLKDVKKGVFFGKAFLIEPHVQGRLTKQKHSSPPIMFNDEQNASITC